jgi:hypothetical protein
MTPLLPQLKRIVFNIPFFLASALWLLCLALVSFPFAAAYSTQLHQEWMMGFLFPIFAILGVGALMIAPFFEVPILFLLLLYSPSTHWDFFLFMLVYLGLLLLIPLSAVLLHRRKLKEHHIERKILKISMTFGFLISFLVFAWLLNWCDRYVGCSGGEPVSGDAALILAFINLILIMPPITWWFTKIGKELENI